MYRIHGHYYEKLYRTYKSMITRCTNPKRKDFKYYGGKGIKVCEEWLNDYETFKSWAMSHGYSDNLTLDRIDASGNYEPSNCRWVSMVEQSNNKGCNVIITFNGESHTLKQWSEITGINYYTMHKRYKKGRSIEEILSTTKLKRSKTNGTESQKTHIS